MTQVTINGVTINDGDNGLDCNDFNNTQATSFLSAAEFEEMDAAGNRDGIVTEAEFRQYLSDHNINTTNYNNSSLSTAFNNIASLDGVDSSITLNEWASDRLPSLTLPGFSRYDFTGLDTDHDGRISRDEWTASGSPFRNNTIMFDFIASRNSSRDGTITTAALHTFISDTRRWANGNFSLADIRRLVHINSGLNNNILTKLGINREMFLNSTVIETLFGPGLPNANITMESLASLIEAVRSRWDTMQFQDSDFGLIDSNGDSQIDRAEWNDFLSITGIQMQYSSQIFSRIAGNGNSTIDLTSFASYINRLDRIRNGELTPDDFAYIDLNADGRISATDWGILGLPTSGVQGVLGRLYSFVSNGTGTISADTFMFTLIDADGNGGISQSEWSAARQAFNLTDPQNLAVVLADGTITLAEFQSMYQTQQPPPRNFTTTQLIYDGLADDFRRQNDVARGLAARSASVYLPGLDVTINASDGLDASELFLVGQSSSNIETRDQALTLMPQKIDSIVKSLLKYAQG